MATAIKKTVKKTLKNSVGTHVMPNGKVMKDSAHKKTKK